MKIVYMQAPLYLHQEQTICFFVMDINNNKVPWNDNLVTIYIHFIYGIILPIDFHIFQNV